MESIACGVGSGVGVGVGDGVGVGVGVGLGVGVGDGVGIGVGRSVTFSTNSIYVSETAAAVAAASTEAGTDVLTGPKKDVFFWHPKKFANISAAPIITQYCNRFRVSIWGKKPFNNQDIDIKIVIIFNHS